MITIIHGDDIENSRNYLNTLKQSLVNLNILDGDGLIYDTFFQTLSNSQLFTEDITTIVENFFSKNKVGNEDYKKIANFINSEKKLNLIFWESQELTKSQQSLIKNSTLKLFSYPKNIFLFLDNLRPGNNKFLFSLIQGLRKSTDEEIILFMMIRQFRLLISMRNNTSKNIDENKKLLPWQISKLKRQLSYFDDSIVEYYSNLFEIDLGQKTGKFPYSLDKSIDFFLAGL